MKTKRFYIIGAVLLAVLGTFLYQNHESVKKSDLAFENIEALSGDENIWAQFCNDLCTDSPGNVCSNTTATGVTINCMDMKKQSE